ncbi:hypothetical protein A1Q1_03377 [Trichosporon asahii var. asahii CBS 2479]|uniref:Endoplasmic reticulum protein n=1 Tax=Trichosporon asahii var. asahii (strain ATCC 90039 / CBS 2479 / JCM 2466 / KCTC 7840 / NBRC 103889/ NCYC 2677 / UAMH 7654) TaxID=1186058 RepID=J4UKZ5_TRIAS|nr:hypothetical protein A1Q1_03377 [Trichosporon asahii var. asahii CBS 2479]EJT52575.1 hypothetical protein A1Q1_03377 [Trichosporon asahii var. asahii CBS 2479]
MGPILRHLTFATVLEVLFSTVDVLKLAQATLQFMCDHVRPILESPQLHLILFKFLLKELLRVHAGLKLILSAIGALLGTLVATLCWALFLLITGGHWGHRLTLNRLCIYLVFFLPIAPAPILILLGFAEDVFSPTAYCTAIHLAVYTCAIQLALVYPTATINRDSVPELPEEEIVMLHMASNTLAMLVLNLRNGCGFSLTLKFLEHGGPLDAGNVFALTSSLYFLTRGPYLVFLFGLRGARPVRAQLQDYGKIADDELRPLDLICLVYLFWAPSLCKAVDAAD